MKLQIIIGSTRPERVSDRIADWVAAEAGELNHTEVEIVDLADYKMPFFDEPGPPQYLPERNPVPEVTKFITKLDKADAFVIVTPEYNRSYPAVLKNALDFIDFQFKQKPIALVAHGSSGGAQAVSHLRGTIPGLLGVTIPSATYLVGRAGEMINGEGVLQEELKANPYGPQSALKKMLTELKWYSDALASARAKD